MIYVVNGPNMNLLGRREPEIYGGRTLEQINKELEELAFLNDSRVTCFQSNHEGELIDFLQKAVEGDFVILNAGGLTHTSVSLRDCIAAIDADVIEVHMSNISAREHFRRRSLLSPVCAGVISGFGADVYKMALEWCLEKEEN